MDWKDFFKPTTRKIVFLVLLLLSSYPLMFISMFAGGIGGLINITSLMVFISPFTYLLPPQVMNKILDTNNVTLIASLGVFINIASKILNLAYDYLLVCIFSYAVFHKGKRILFGSILILIFLAVALGQKIWQTSYSNELIKQDQKTYTNPYGSKKYHQDVVELGWIRKTTGFNLYKELLNYCYARIKPEATFNNGGNIQKTCIEEVESRKNDTSLDFHTTKW
jgi:hypothetical protein